MKSEGMRIDIWSWDSSAVPLCRRAALARSRNEVEFLDGIAGGCAVYMAGRVLGMRAPRDSETCVVE